MSHGRRSAWSRAGTPAVVLLLAAPLEAVTAQRNPDSTRAAAVRQSPTPSNGRLPVTGCSGQTISDIVVITQPPFADRLPRRFDWVRQTARTLHVNTRDDVVRRFLLLKPGEPCNQIKRAESERILRAQPFLVDARIRAYEADSGEVRLEVETRDDFSVIFEPVVRGGGPVFQGLRFGETNLAGSARLLAAEWRNGRAYNDVLGVSYTDFQFLGQRDELRLEARRNPFGQRMEAQVVRPYYTDLQRFAWVGGVGGTREPMRLLRGNFPENAVNVRRAYADVGGLVRAGPVGRLKLVGLSFTREEERVDSLPFFLTPEGVRVDSLGARPPLYPQQNVMRANLLLGVRALRFVRVQGFDALTGAQDVRVGAQVGVALGHSIPTGAARDRDRFLSTNVYLGAGGEKWFVGAQGISEGRYDLQRSEWNNLVASGRAAWYFRPAISQTTVVQAEWGVGRRMLVPFQLSLADRIGGVLGHRFSSDPGASRLVLRAEQRFVIPTRLNLADVGFAAFAEGGRLWAEESVPFSTDTPWRGSVGVSLLAAVPPRSRRLWRLDVGLPVSNDPRKRIELRVTGFDRSRAFWRDTPDVERSRERTAPTSLFTWP
jgi:hypothetical protein